jgi:hypothetical protein
VDAPRDDQRVLIGEKLSLHGWVLDTAATGWPGIDEVHVYQGTAADTFLGRAQYGVERRDVADHFMNEGWKNSGFTFTVETANTGAGPVTLTVYAHTPLRGWWSKSVTINLARESPIESGTAETSWRTPGGHSLRTVGSMIRPLEALAETMWGAWAMDALADRGLHVLWSNDLGNRFSNYQYGARTVYVNETLLSAQPRAVAAAVAHELQHALDDVSGWASWRALSCIDLASRSFVAQAATWSSFYGPFGKVQPENPLEEAHNFVLNAVTARPATWLDDSVARYRSPCA